MEYDVLFHSKMREIMPRMKEFGVLFHLLFSVYHSGLDLEYTSILQARKFEKSAN